MSRARRRNARDARTARLAVALAAGLDASRPAAVLEVEAYEAIAARHLGLRHLGRWVLIRDRLPSTQLEHREPTMLEQAGRLVGLRPGGPGSHGAEPFRVLVLQQGGLTAPLHVTLGAAVEVAP